MIAKISKIKFALVLLLVFTSCSARKTPLTLVDQSELRQRLETYHLGEHRFRPVSCNGEAIADFDRGLALSYGFNYDAAEKEFGNAILKDPECAMAYWGIALVNGPHINFPLVPPEKAAVAFKNITLAKANSGKVTEIERDLISALDKRYVEHQPADRSALDQTYAKEMKLLSQKYPKQSDVRALFVDALMDLHPWDLWNEDQSPKEWTPEIQSELEAILKLDPDHPHANHLYIHTMEASATPELAVSAANRLTKLVPGSGHLVHMPAHIYARVGRWEDSAVSNQGAIKADAVTSQFFPKPGFYSVYMIHSQHFLAFTRMMQGNSTESVSIARAMIASIPDEFLKQFGPIADGYLIFVSEALMRFGKWEEILKEPTPRGNYQLSTALWRFTRAIAYNSLEKKDSRDQEREKFIAAVKRIPESSTFGNNPSRKVAEIARLVLDGEIAAREGQVKKAIKLLAEAVIKEDKLKYDEPPDWILPARHALGMLLLRNKQYKDAETIYLQDLVRYPENGWSLFGLSKALELQGKEKEANEVLERCKKVWSPTDPLPTTTCHCQKGIM